MPQQIGVQPQEAPRPLYEDVPVPPIHNVPRTQEFIVFAALRIANADFGIPVPMVISGYSSRRADAPTRR